MDDKVICFNTRKAWNKVLLGLGIMLTNILVLKATWFIVSFFLGGSFIFFGLKSISKKPQLIFSEKGLFIGFTANKLIPWSTIEKIAIKKKTIDFRDMSFLEITIRIKSNGPSNKLVRDFPFENLDISNIELQLIIDNYMQRAKRGIMDSLT